MSLLICKVFYIFLLYFQVVLSVRHVGPIWEIYRSMNPPYQDCKDPGTRTSSHTHATPPTHPWRFHLANKNSSYKNFTQLDFFPLELLHNIDVWYAGLVNHNQLKQVLVRLTHHHPFLHASTAYNLKYVPFDYYTHYEHIQCSWA